jgi:hypothetical protein
MYCILTTVKLLAKINKHIIENLFPPRLLNFGIIVIYTISAIKAILQDSNVKIADNEGVSPSSSVITRVSCNMPMCYVQNFI